MQFVMNGGRHELTREQVAETARRIVPDDIDGRHKYYASIGGGRFPVKQLFAEATGLPRDEFITYEALRIFRKLGIEVNEFDCPAPPPPDSGAYLPGLDTPKEKSAETYTFAVRLEPDEDGFIVASCPQLPGCYSQGRSRPEAVKNIQEAIRGYLISMRRHGEELAATDWELVSVSL